MMGKEEKPVSKRLRKYVRPSHEWEWHWRERNANNILLNNRFNFLLALFAAYIAAVLQIKTIELFRVITIITTVILTGLAYAVFRVYKRSDYHSYVIHVSKQSFIEGNPFSSSSSVIDKQSVTDLARKSIPWHYRSLSATPVVGWIVPAFIVGLLVFASFGTFAFPCVKDFILNTIIQ